MEWQPELLPGVEVVRYTGDTKCWVGYSTQFGLNVVTDGAFEFWYRRRAWRHAAGRVKLKEPGEIHRDLRVLAPVSGVSIALAPSLVQRAAEALELPVTHFRRVVVDDARLGRLALQLAAGLGRDRLASESLIAETLTTMLCHAERELPRGPALPVQRAREYLEAHLAEPITITGLADAVGQDPFRLTRGFRAALGVPPYAYLTHLRVARARGLLAAGVPPAEVALQVGFCDQSQLNRHFTRRIGLSPGRYARAAKVKK
jgi:AraC-like DNA-binding protein